jgi:hypothetical protein
VINKAENPPFIIADKTDALEDTRFNTAISISGVR